MKRYTLLYIVGVLCTFMNLSWAYASNPVKEGNVITGHVIEKGSEASIAYATVLIVETGKGTVTNDEGYFRFKDIPAGEYTQLAQLPVRSARGKQLSELWFPASPHQWSGRPLFADPYQQPSGDERLVGCIRTGADSGEYD